MPTPQTDALQFIADFFARYGYSPSIREVQSALGLASSRSAYTLLIELRDAGLITWTPRLPRTIRLVLPDPNWLHDDLTPT